ncbi:hypothetical protein GGS20DRAFT_164045 [Poronia punctata]|nr:hypothetical protein GGS20DRAFT_164045 [Poronia punctata]
MVTSQFGVLTPVQYFNQQQQQQYNQSSYQTTPPPSSAPQPQQRTHAQLSTNDILNGDVHPSMQPNSQQVHGQTQRTTQIQTQTRNLPSALVPTTDTKPNTQTASPRASERLAVPDTLIQRRNKKRRVEENDGPEPISAAPAAPRTPNAPSLSKGPYSTMDDAIFALQLFVFTSGYGVSQKRTVKEKLPSGKYDPSGDVIRKDFACDKGGNEFVSQSRGERRRESKKCGCPWKAAVRRLRREGDRWFIEILVARHNHPMTSQEQMHTLASYRRWQRENNAGIRGAISRLTRAAAMPTRDIVAYLKGELLDAELDRIDKQILRALSMNDREGAVSEKEGSSVVFEMIARRPVIILQDTQPSSTATTATTATNNNYPSTPQPNITLGDFSNQETRSVSFNESAISRNAFPNVFATAVNGRSNPPATMLADATASISADHAYALTTTCTATSWLLAGRFQAAAAEGRETNTLGGIWHKIGLF